MENNDKTTQGQEAQQATTPKTAETTKLNSNERLSVIEEAKQLAETNQRLVQELRAENDRLEKLRAENMLGGKSEIGSPAKPKEVSDADYADAVLSGQIPAE